jgi:hypothetical protein
VAALLGRNGTITMEDRLIVTADINETLYAVGIRITDKQMANLRNERDEFHGEWNYIIKPRALES